VEELRRRGATVALVEHAHGASPGRARLVSPEDDVGVVGDEALMASCRFSELGIPVTVAPSRQEALDLALEVANVAVVDGVCQTTPARATLALLALDAEAPWGAGHCPPRGDLRAPAAELLRAVDRAVAIGGHGLPDVGSVPVDRADIVSEGARLPASLGGQVLGWGALRELRLGLWTRVARPDRIVRWLARHGVFPVSTVFGGDHRPIHPSERPTRGGDLIDVWLVTPKCNARALVATPAWQAYPRSAGGTPIATLDHALRLGKSLTDVLETIVPP
jgi:tetraacyldisaccharide-1-P 4'-kinase